MRPRRDDELRGFVTLYRGRTRLRLMLPLPVEEMTAAIDELASLGYHLASFDAAPSAPTVPPLARRLGWRP